MSWLSYFRDFYHCFQILTFLLTLPDLRAGDKDSPHGVWDFKNHLLSTNASYILQASLSHHTPTPTSPPLLLFYFWGCGHTMLGALWEKKSCSCICLHSCAFVDARQSRKGGQICSLFLILLFCWPKILLRTRLHIQKWEQPLHFELLFKSDLFLWLLTLLYTLLILPILYSQIPHLLSICLLCKECIRWNGRGSRGKKYFPWPSPVDFL